MSHLRNDYILHFKVSYYRFKYHVCSQLSLNPRRANRLPPSQNNSGPFTVASPFPFWIFQIAPPQTRSFFSTTKAPSELHTRLRGGTAPDV